MFKEAGDLLDDSEEVVEESEVHVVSFRWDRYTPELMFYNGETPEEMDLGKIDINVSSEKICVGSFEEGYEPCPEQKNVDKFNQCPNCASDDIPRLECIFEPQGCEDCEGGFCEREHAVYLAFHGTYPKIGMTQKSRLEERMIEQGADAYALLVTTDHRRDAREEEKRISSKLNISQRIGSKKKLKTLSKKLDRQTIETKFRGIRNRIPVGKLNYLSDYPITTPLRAAPRLRPTAGLHRGEMVGVKGKFLIYENNGLQALDLSDLPGRRMKMRG